MDDPAGNSAERYLTFEIADELLALEVSLVREVHDLCPITRVPGTPAPLRGLINLRGAVIPVIDIRLQFGLDAAESTAASRIVVIEINLDDADTAVGLLTDAVHDVIEIDHARMEDPAKMGSGWRTAYIRGIARQANLFILLLDIDRLVADLDRDQGSGESLARTAPPTCPETAGRP